MPNTDFYVYSEISSNYFYNGISLFFLLEAFYRSLNKAYIEGTKRQVHIHKHMTRLYN